MGKLSFSAGFLGTTVMNYVTMLVISDLSIFVYLSYHISRWPLLASTVSLISPVYKIN